MMSRSVRARRGERWRRLPGDGFIEPAGEMLTNAITMRRPRSEVWPWLAQMGPGRAKFSFVSPGSLPNEPSTVDQIPSSRKRP
jgi:hypothetical protein